MGIGNRIDDIKVAYLKEVFKDSASHYRYRHSLSGGRFNGQYVSSSLDKLRAGVEVLLAEGVLNKAGIFGDMGGGTGEIVAFFAGVHGMPSLYVERDNVIIECALDKFERIGQLPILQQMPVTIACGDFLSDETYWSVGLLFEHLSVIHNYWANQEALARKIRTQSPQGTAFLLASNRDSPQKIGELKLKLDIDLDRIVYWEDELKGPHHMGIYIN